MPEPMIASLLNDSSLQRRDGDPPLTTRPTPATPFPHQQLTQPAPLDLQDELVARAVTLPHVRLTDSCISVPGSRAFRLDETKARGPAEAFQCGTEFAHLHPPADGSLHLTLPATVYEAVLNCAWGEPHPISGTMMLFGPRNQAELETVWQIILSSYRFALGEQV